MATVKEIARGIAQLAPNELAQIEELLVRYRELDAATVRTNDAARRAREKLEEIDPPIPPKGGAP